MIIYTKRIFFAYDHIADGFFDENFFFSFLAKSKLYSRFGEIDYYLAVSIIGCVCLMRKLPCVVFFEVLSTNQLALVELASFLSPDQSDFLEMAELVNLFLNDSLLFLMLFFRAPSFECARNFKTFAFVNAFKCKHCKQNVYLNRVNDEMRLYRCITFNVKAERLSLKCHLPAFIFNHFNG